ncbi:MAG: 3-hydroxyacyl-[acyl-carrier-protein] dehydratase FabZ [Magnetovibrio sp.]|nr:3-hydroxyacyl-[acyl-carrier-protein] dehydratase FabZ [Magnetovibrio sp.]|tara:strand:- start:57 stop:524 length:468 start_codon:yes stop_codon:yes gene_type:complete
MAQEPSKSENFLNIKDIMEMIPHRYPFLLIDRVFDIVPGERAVGIKNVTINEQFFSGHFGDHPIMPGVLIVEAMAQTAAITVIQSLDSENKNSLVYFLSIEQAKFRKPVTPGDSLRIFVEKAQERGGVWKFKGSAKVEEILVAEATFTAMIMEQE